jgi:hypothetical protein
MNPVIDHIIIALLVLMSTVIVGYSLSPLKAKRWILSRMSRVVGVRVVTWLLPKQCGCDDCPTTEVHARLKTRIGQS